jgi:phosphoglycerate kinase
MKSFVDLDLKDKRVLLRADLNVPANNGKIEDYTRITRLKPTIDLLIKKEAKIILISHFDRPEGKKIPSMSLAFMPKELAKIYGTNVHFSDETVGSFALPKTKNLPNGEILLLENLRFDSREEKNDSDFAQELAKLGDIYVNDAFACSHRAHASISAITKFLPSYAGLLLLEEVINLEKTLNGSEKPNIAIVGGKKVSTKFPILNNLSKKVDYLVIGGAMANTFVKAMGKEIGSSYYESDLVNAAQKFLNETSCKIVIPTDFIIAKKEGDNFINPQEKDISQISADDVILDIGSKTVADIATILEKSKCVMWNGPLGMYEDERFAHGTNKVAEAISKLRITSIAGGGDIVAALEKTNFAKDFTYISTAGGAFLEWLEGKELPGIIALTNSPKN